MKGQTATHTPVKIGVQYKNGLAEIMTLLFRHDPGDHFRVIMVKKINLPNGGEAEFSWHNPKTGNCIYREL